MRKANIMGGRLDSKLKLYVNSEGKVDYNLIEKDTLIEDYYKKLQVFDLSTLKTQNQKLAFWINTYNMLTLYGVVHRLQADPKYIQRGNSGWIMRFIFFYLTKYHIDGRKLSLYQIENSILRRQLGEPRIHFALNCASESCPLLKNGLYDPENLDKELDLAARLFIQSPRGVQIIKANHIIYLSKIFKWYKRDFLKKAPSILAFIIPYLREEDQDFLENSANLQIKHLDYNWGLNTL